MGSTYYYTGYADDQGSFEFLNVRAGSYGLQAWSNGSSLADVTTEFLQDGVRVGGNATTELGPLRWAISNKTKLFQVGDFDRHAHGFRYGGAPYAHAVASRCPADLTYTVGSSRTGDWCFAQTQRGNWTIAFEVPEGSGEGEGAGAGGPEATLIVSLAGYATGTSATIAANGGTVIGNLTSGTEKLLNDPSLYRSATVAGEWRYLEFWFDAGVLKSGSNNITFEVTRNTTWHGIMWDSIVLEW